MTYKTFHLPLLFTVLIAAVLAGCQRSVPPVVKVGLVAPFEGAQRAVGYDVIYSARLAVRQINEAGGIGGYRVALVALDDSGSVEFARKTAVSLTLDPSVVAVIGHWHPANEASAADVAAIYADAGLLYIPMSAADTMPVAQLDPAFVAAYEAVTPFDETPGPYAGPAYATFSQLWQVLQTAVSQSGELNREVVWNGEN
ncbi:MAG: hypothetical protein Kow0080_06940 [Candidatus Promineifilaceae bacterium]